MTTILPDHDTIIASLGRWWRNRRQAVTALGEINALSQANLAGVAADCGVSTDALVALIKAGPNAADEMREMLKALSIDVDALQDRDRRLFQDMMATCAGCRDKARCRQDLKQGAAAENYLHYCANSETVDELRATPDMLAG